MESVILVAARFGMGLCRRRRGYVYGDGYGYGYVYGDGYGYGDGNVYGDG